MNKQAWSDALKSYIQSQRTLAPIPERASLTDEEEWQCRIIGGEFLSWGEQHLGQIMGQRVALRFMKFDPEPLFVVTTNMPGLVALQEIAPEPSPQLVYLLHEEFKSWEASHRIDSFTFHIHHWSFFEPLDAELKAKAIADFPDVDPLAFRLHQAGDLWGERCGVMGQHLWNWDGQSLSLLEEAFTSIRY